MNANNTNSSDWWLNIPMTNALVRCITLCFTLAAQIIPNYINIPQVVKSTCIYRMKTWKCFLALQRVESKKNCIVLNTTERDRSTCLSLPTQPLRNNATRIPSIWSHQYHALSDFYFGYCLFFCSRMSDCSLSLPSCQKIVSRVVVSCWPVTSSSSHGSWRIFALVGQLERSRHEALKIH
jgi:hypothetical protein